MRLKTLSFFFLTWNSISFPMADSKSFNRRLNSSLEKIVGEDVPIEETEKTFDFTGYCLQKFSKTIKNQDRDEVAIVIKSSPIFFAQNHTYSTLHEAAMADDCKGIQRLLASGHEGWLNGFDHEGQTPLQKAIDYGCINAIACLIHHGACVGVYNREYEYNAWTLAKAYFDSKVFTNVAPFIVLSELISQKGELHLFKTKKQKKPLEQKKAPEVRPNKKIRLRKNIPRDPTPELEADYDPYLSNV